VGVVHSKVVAAIPVSKLFSIVRERFYIPRKYRRIELRVQGGFPQKIVFSEIA
jgi:hypothetical protein